MNNPDFHSDFRALVELHQERVRSTCFRFVNDSDDADDLAQEVFIQVLESIHHFRSESEITTWIYRIAVNKSLDFLRKQNRRKRIAGLFRLHPGWEEEATPPSSVGNPHQELEENERRQLLNRSVARLPENQRTAIILSKYEQLPIKEIAGVMDVSVPSVEALIHRAKKNLHRLLREYFESRK